MNLPSWLQNLVAYSFQIAVIVGAGALAARIFPLRIPKVRLAFWQTLLVVCLVFPFIQPRTALPVAHDFGVATVSNAISSAVQQSHWFDVPPWIAGALIAVAVGRLLWLFLGLARLRRYRLRARPLTDSEGLISRIRRSTKVRADLLLSDDVDGPVTFGLMRPVVMLPLGIVRMPDAQMHAVVCHELLHVKRGDWAFTIAEECLRAVFWFHPAVHWLVGRIRLSREQTVDQEVVLACGARHDYLDALIEIARSSQRLRPVPGHLCLSRPRLKDRIELLLKEVTMSRLKLSSYTTANAAAVLIAGVMAVWSFPMIGTPDGKTNEAGDGREQPKTEMASASGETVSVPEPKVVKKVMPVYPAEARTARIQGRVELETTITETGEVRDIKVLQGIPDLNQAAIDAVGQWRYEPVRGDDGKPVAVKLVITINFRLEKEKKSAAGSP
jgi:TonB family protein